MKMLIPTQKRISQALRTMEIETPLKEAVATLTLQLVGMGRIIPASLDPVGCFALMGVE